MSREAYLDRRRRQIRAVHPEGKAVAALARQVLRIDRDHPDAPLGFVEKTAQEYLRTPSPEEGELFNYAQSAVDVTIHRMDGRAKPISYPLEQVRVYTEDYMKAVGEHVFESTDGVDSGDRMFLQPYSERNPRLQFLLRAVHELFHAKSKFGQNWGESAARMQSGASVEFFDRNVPEGEDARHRTLFDGVNEALTQSWALDTMDDIYVDPSAPYGQLRREWEEQHGPELALLKTQYRIDPTEVLLLNRTDNDNFTFMAPYQYEMGRLRAIIRRIAGAEHTNVSEIEKVFGKWYLHGHYQPVGTRLREHYGQYAGTVLSRWNAEEPPARRELLDAFIFADNQASRDEAAREFIETSEYNRVLRQAKS